MRINRMLPAVFVVCWLAAVGPATRLAAAADQPLAETALRSLVELKIDDEAVIARIRKAGLAFAPDEAALKRLTDAGASAGVLRAVRDAGAAKPAGRAEAITHADVLKLLQLEIPEEQILKRLAKSPTVFTLSAEQIAELKAAGASAKLLTALQAPREVSPQTAELITNFALVLDCSGSMKEKTKEGETKMVAAKRVVTDLIRKIPEGLNVTFVIYGHEVFGTAEDPRNCQAVKIARPLSPLDAAAKSGLSRLVQGLQPTGATPIALSLRVAGEELAKQQEAFCGIVVITDGLESCKGDPAAEAAALVSKLKLTFGVNVVGFGVKAQENAALEAIADAGKGKYYAAQDAGALADAISAIAKELAVQAKPAEVVDVSRRALRILQPKVELPAMKEVFLVEAGQADRGVYTKTASINKYGEYLAVPSSSKKYDVVWVPAAGKQVYLMRDFVLPERKVFNVKPETIFGMIRVKGAGKVNYIIAMPAGKKPAGVFTPTSRVDNYGDILVVPAGKYDVHVSDASGKLTTLEEDLDVESGKMVQLE